MHQCFTRNHKPWRIHFGISIIYKSSPASSRCLLFFLPILSISFFSPIEVETFWEIVLETTCYLIIIKKQGERIIVEERRILSNLWIIFLKIIWMKFLIIICAILSSKKDEFKFTASLDCGEIIFKCFSSNLQRWVLKDNCEIRDKT